MADAGRKQLEQVMHQLQEQLQINLLQQTHLMQAGEKAGPKSQAAMQQLQMQQQQLISQLQLVQQRILLVSQFFATLSTGGVRIGSNFTLVESRFHLMMNWPKPEIKIMNSTHRHLFNDNSF